jgi:hypothetical protein
MLRPLPLSLPNAVPASALQTQFNCVVLLDEAAWRLRARQPTTHVIAKEIILFMLAGHAAGG